MCDPLSTMIAGAVVSGGTAMMDSRNNRKANDKAQEQRARSQAFIEGQLKQGRRDLFDLYSAGQQTRRQGMDALMGLYGQTMPQQMNAFRQGNMNAQQTVSAALPQMQNALLGRPVDMAQIQPRAVEGLAGLQMPQAQATIPIDQLARALGGM